MSNVHFFLETYSAARSKLRQAEETSALETDREDDAGRPRRKKRRALSSSANESSPEKNHKKPPKVEVLSKLLPASSGNMYADVITSTNVISVLWVAPEQADKFATKEFFALVNARTTVDRYCIKSINVSTETKVTFAVNKNLINFKLYA
jgi:hypothetical protein